MSESNTSISYPTAATGALGSSIAPCEDSRDETFALVVESRNERGVEARSGGFAPFFGTRILEGEGITQQTLRSGGAVAVIQLDDEAVIPGLGPDYSFNVQTCVEQIPGAPPVRVEREIANVGAILTNEGGDGSNLSRDPKMVGRLWKMNPETGINEYLQFIDGEVVFAPTSRSQEQAFQWVSEACGNFGIMRTNPQHRLDLGPSPCDDGAPFGAYLGNYIILADPESGEETILTTEDGDLLVNGRRVRLERHCPCKKHDCHW